MSSAKDPTRIIAGMALQHPAEQHPGQCLREIIDYAFDQLCWMMSEVQLREITAALNAKLDEENS
jgi:hypothetical protein